MDEEDVAFGRREKKELAMKIVDKNGEKSSEGVLVTYADEVYSMKQQKGKCIIFNHMTFTCGADDRPDSGLDANALKDFFKSRGFDVEIYLDRKVSQITTILENESQKKNEYHKASSCFVCCVLTHGILKDGKEYLCAKDNIYPTEQLFEPFAGNRCEPLAGKPKLFFIEACRGYDFDPGVNVFSLFRNLGLGLLSLQLMDTKIVSCQTSQSSVCCKIPVKADFLIAYATAPNFIAWKRNGEGSWFIQALCEVLKARANDSDLLSMLTIVCRKVAYEYESLNTESTATDTKKQVPSVYSTLTKMVKFPPKES